MKVLRYAFAGAGVTLIAVGAVKLLQQGDLFNLVPWLVAPVLIHDLLLAPFVICLVWLGHRLLPGYAHTPAMVGMLVSGGLTLVALSVIGRAGAAVDNPSLLDRNYLQGWLNALLVVWVAVAAIAVVQRARRRAEDDRDRIAGTST